jgi:hypothetical protein
MDLSMGSVGDPWDNAIAESSSPHSRKNSSAASASPPASRHDSESSGTSNASTTPAAGTPASAYLSPNDYEHRHQQEAIAA